MNVLILLIRALAFYLIPIVIGRGLVMGWHITKKTHSHRERVLSRVLHLPIYLAIGSLVMFGLALLPLTRPLFFPLVGVLTLVCIGLNLTRLKFSEKFLQPSLWLGLLLALSVSLLSYGIWTWRSPTPLNWDLYEHQTLANLIQHGSMSFFTTQISDTFGFNSYPPIFHVLLAVAQYPGLSPGEVLPFWKAISFLHLVVVSGAAYALGYVVTRKKGVATVSGILGALVFDSVISFTNLFLLPQTFTAVIFILLLSYVLLHLNDKTKIPWWMAFTSLVWLSLNHYVIGSLAAVIYASVYLYHRFPKLIHQRLPILIGLYFFIGVVGVAASYFVDLGFINQGEAASYTFNFATKLEYMRRVYGWSVVIFLPIGLWAMRRARQSQIWLSVLITGGLLAILASQFPYVLKFMVIGRFFIQLFMAIGIWFFLEEITWRPLRWIGLLGLTGTLSIILILNSLTWKQGLYTEHNFVHATDQDVQAAQYLKNNYDASTTLLLSDPGTQYILEGLSGFNSPGGAFASRENREALYQALTSGDPSEKRQQLDQVIDKIDSQPHQKLLVMSGRTFAWLRAAPQDRHSFDFNIWSPRRLTDQNYLDLQVHYGQFFPVYASPYLVIFEFPDQPND